MFYPKEMNLSMGEDWRQVAIFLLLYEEWHEVINLRHADISLIIAAD